MKLSSIEPTQLDSFPSRCVELMMPPFAADGSSTIVLITATQMTNPGPLSDLLNCEKAPEMLQDTSSSCDLVAATIFRLGSIFARLSVCSIFPSVGFAHARAQTAVED